MPKVQIWADVSEGLLRGYENEARRRGVAVESLLEHTVKVLLEEMDEEYRGPDLSVSVS